MKSTSVFADAWGSAGGQPAVVGRLPPTTEIHFAGFALENPGPAALPKPQQLVSPCAPQSKKSDATQQASNFLCCGAACSSSGVVMLFSTSAFERDAHGDVTFYQ